MIFTFRKILVPVDLSEGSREAVRMGASIAERHGASMTVFHVAQFAKKELLLSGGLGMAPPPGGIPWSEMKKKHQKEAEGRLRGLIERVKKRNRIESELTWGEPSQKILEEARKGEFDLIVMTKHRREGLLPPLSKSVTGRVVREARCPVLVF